MTVRQIDSAYGPSCWKLETFLFLPACGGPSRQRTSSAQFRQKADLALKPEVRRARLRPTFGWVEGLAKTASVIGLRSKAIFGHFV